VLKHLGAGQTFTQAPQPMQLSRSNSGLPLYFSGTTQGLAGNRVVNRGEKTAITASFNSLNFGKRNFKLPLFIGNWLLVHHLVFFYCWSISSAYLSTTLFSHNSTPEACAPLAIACAAVGEVINIKTAQIIALALKAGEPLTKATPTKSKIVPRVTHFVEA